MKKLLLLTLAALGSQVYAASDIRYVDVEKVYQLSQIVQPDFTRINQNYQHQHESYVAQQNIIESQVKLVMLNKNIESADMLALREKQLQESFDSLSTSHDKQINALKNSYIIYVREAVLQLRKQNNYAYVLSSSTIIAADQANDISPAVAKLADKLYVKANHTH